MKRVLPLPTLLLPIALAGCATIAPVSLGDNNYEVTSYESKSTLYPRLERFCAARGGEFRYIQTFYNDVSFQCHKPYVGPPPTQRLELDIR